MENENDFYVVTPYELENLEGSWTSCLRNYLFCWFYCICLMLQILLYENTSGIKHQIQRLVRSESGPKRHEFLPRFGYEIARVAQNPGFVHWLATPNS